MRRVWVHICCLMFLATAANAQIAPEDIVRLEADDMTCPQGTEMAYAESPDGLRSARWCQATRGSQVARHGPYLDLYADGSTARQGAYLRGLQAGLWASWTPDGRLVRHRLLAPGEASRYLSQPEDICPPGSLRDRSTGHDHKRRMWSKCQAPSENPEDGEPILVGPYVTWDEETTPQGPRYKLRQITHYENDERHGPHLVYEGHFQREQLVEEETYVEGSLQGESRAFYLDGSPRELRHYENGRFVGERVAYFQDGSERWRIVYEDGRPATKEGDFTVGGEPCPERSVPVTSANGLEEFCASRSYHFLTRNGPFLERNASGRIVKSGLYKSDKITELWDAPAGVELPPRVSDDVLVAEIRLMVGDIPYDSLNSPTEEESVAAAEPEYPPMPEAPSWEAEQDPDAYREMVEAWEEKVRDWDSQAQAISAAARAEVEAEANAVPPFDIWFIDNKTRKYPHPRTEVENGVVRVYGLSPGSYYMKTEINAETSNDLQWPGDLFSSTDFPVRLGEVTQTEALLLHSLHLLEPWDNNEKIPGWGDACTSEEAVLDGPVRFRWKPPTNDEYGAVEYHYVLSRYSCDPSRELEVVAKGSTSNLHFLADLAPSRTGERYVWSLLAKRDGKAIGQMMTFGNGYGWNLSFRVR